MKNRNRSRQRNTRNYRNMFIEGLRTVGFAFVFVLVLHIFLFQPFVVPTPSMAGTVLPGDHIIVSKLHYGPQTPRTLGIPFTDLYINNFELPAVKLPGFSEITRGDVIVFHYPPEEKPIDKRQPYLKRVYGLPGDMLELRDKIIYVNDEPQEFPAEMRQYWRVVKTDARVSLSGQRLSALGVEEILPIDDQTVRIMASRDAIAEIQSWPYIESVKPYISSFDVRSDRLLFPPAQEQTVDNYGPIWIPKAGETRPLTDENWSLYGPIITRFERRPAQRTDDGAFLVDGMEVTQYTFAKDYYFMIGDNRDNSLDSRFWGFVPADHIMGKAVLTFFSWDKERARPRLDRVMKVIR